MNGEIYAVRRRSLKSVSRPHDARPRTAERSNVPPSAPNLFSLSLLVMWTWKHNFCFFFLSWFGVVDVFFLKEKIGARNWLDVISFPFQKFCLFHSGLYFYSSRVSKRQQAPAFCLYSTVQLNRRRQLHGRWFILTIHTGCGLYCLVPCVPFFSLSLTDLHSLFCLSRHQYWIILSIVQTVRDVRTLSWRLLSTA